MQWNWQDADWPKFTYDAEGVAPLERKFLQSSGEVIGAVRHFSEDDSGQLRIELLSDEAVKTSDIFISKVYIPSRTRRAELDAPWLKSPWRRISGSQA